MSKNTNPHWGSTLDDFLKEESIYQIAKTTAAMRVMTYALNQHPRTERWLRTRFRNCSINLEKAMASATLTLGSMLSKGFRCCLQESSKKSEQGLTG